MKKLLSLIIVSAALLVAQPALANSPTNQFANCLVDTLNGKERKNLAKWIFLAIGSHPEISSYSNATSETIEESDKYVGKLVTRLLTEDCPTQLAAALKADPLAINKGFELVGQVAMQELMANPATMSALTNYTKYTDQAKINALLGQ